MATTAAHQLIMTPRSCHGLPLFPWLCSLARVLLEELAGHCALLAGRYLLALCSRGFGLLLGCCCGGLPRLQRGEPDLIVGGHGCPGADGAGDRVMPLRSAVLAAEENDLQGEIVPYGFRKRSLEVILCLDHVLAVRQSPALREPVDVGVHWEGGVSKRLRHDNTGGLVPHASQHLQLLKRSRNLPLVLLHQHVCGFSQVGRLCLGEPNFLDDLLDCRGVQLCHGCRIRCHSE
mmetsp:Transcript_1237/g.2895  ORF Transcript_1237/g.2895 Transcript_1237/m.2895 type:complete len:233 (-) Transcript_1237:288-986(-)